MMFSAAMVRYMEPKTTTPFSEQFENDGSILDIIYTGYHKWRSQTNKSYHFMNEAGGTFRPKFSYAVYRKKFTNDEALEYERQNLGLKQYEEITSNDFPFHYNRAKKRRQTEMKRLRDEKWENASDDERKRMYDQIQNEKRRERIIKDLKYVFL